MGHWVLGTMNAFIYCVVFMVTLVALVLMYVFLSWLCSQEESESNDEYIANGNTGNNANNNNNFSPQVPRHNPEPTRHENIPLMTRPEIRVSPSAQRTYPVDSPSTRVDPSPPYPISPAMPMPSPRRYSPTPSAPLTSNQTTDLPPTYEQAITIMPQPPYNPNYPVN